MKTFLLLLIALPAMGFPFMVGARVSTPQIASLSLAYRPTDMLFLQVEPGIGGGKAALGVGGSFGYRFGIGLKSSLLYTWGTRWGMLKRGRSTPEARGSSWYPALTLPSAFTAILTGIDPRRICWFQWGRA